MMRFVLLGLCAVLSAERSFASADFAIVDFGAREAASPRENAAAIQKAIEGCGVHPVEDVAFDGMRFEVYARDVPYYKDWEVVGTNCDHDAAIWIDRARNVRFRNARITFRHDHGDTRSRAISVVNSENVTGIPME